MNPRTGMDNWLPSPLIDGGFDAIASAVIHESPDFVIAWDGRGAVRFLNGAAARHVTGLGIEADLELRHLFAPRSLALLAGEARQAIEAGGSWGGELLLSARGGLLPVSAVVVGANGTGLTAMVGRDVTGYKNVEARLAHQATHDRLTGLANRNQFLSCLEAVLDRSGGRREANSAVLFLDVDRFKAINDTLGHDIGDRLLVEIARRLEAVVRPTDVVARLGGDEFVILCEGVGDERSALALAERVRTAIERPFRLPGKGDLGITASVGISMGDGLGAEALLRNADVAMYQAKERGRDRCALFDEALRQRTVGRLTIEAELRDALARGDFRVLYQPQYSLGNGTIVGMEALVRWHHPERGVISPADFIPVAEETGLIVPIGSWVLEQACAQARAWSCRRRSGAPLCMHVNLSPRQFTQPDLAQMVTEMLERASLAPAALCLEITETAVMEAIDHAAVTLQRLRDLGIKVAIDDFGTGHSSLSYLRRLPVDIIKIDKSFIDRLGDDTTDSAIVMAVVNLARSLGLTVVAEGVETEKQRRELRALGCALAQGFYFSRPVAPQVLTEMLDDEIA